MRIKILGPDAGGTQIIYGPCQGADQGRVRFQCGEIARSLFAEVLENAGDENLGPPEGDEPARGGNRQLHNQAPHRRYPQVHRGLSRPGHLFHPLVAHPSVWGDKPLLGEEVLFADRGEILDESVGCEVCHSEWVNPKSKKISLTPIHRGMNLECVMPGGKLIMKEHNLITGHIVNAAYLIHRKLGSGLFESVYEAILYHELSKRGLRVDRQKPIPIRYGEISFDEGFRASLVVDNKVIVELKSVERVLPVHKKQLLTYLRLAEMRVGLLINFGENLIKNGIYRIVNGL